MHGSGGEALSAAMEKLAAQFGMGGTPKQGRFEEVTPVSEVSGIGYLFLSVPFFFSV